jgi:hypothetical protein
MKSLPLRRLTTGVSLVELACGLLLAIPIFLIVFDCAVIAIGLQTNDKVCRESARAAADGNPASAELQARSVIEKANSEKAGIIADLRLVSVENTMNMADLKKLKAIGGTIAGTVTVTTAVDLNPIFIHWLTPNQNIWTFQSRQSFPYTYVVPRPAIDE